MSSTTLDEQQIQDFIDGFNDAEWALDDDLALLDKKIADFAEEPIFVIGDDGSGGGGDEAALLWNDEPSISNTTASSSSATSTISITVTPGLDEAELCWDRDKQPVAVRGGSLTKLIEYATHPDAVDSQFVRELLHTLRSFTEPEEFLAGLVDRFRSPLASGDQAKRMQLRVFNLLKSWLSTAASDFQDNDALVDATADFALEIAAAVPGADATLHKLLAKRRTRKHDRQRTIVFSQPPPKSLVAAHGSAAQLYFLDVPLLELARQLTLIEHDLYRSILPSEFFRCGWSKPGKERSSPNVLAMVQRFNQVSQWIAHEVLRAATPKARAKRIELMLELAKHCEELNNFNCITEVLAGIDNSAVYRLKRTWPHVSAKHQRLYDQLKATVSSSGAYKAQREALHGCEPPCVPYLGMYLTDLTFIEDGNKDDIEHAGARLINFRKRRMLAAVLSEIQIYQQTPYCLAPIPYVQLYLLSCKPPNNEQLFQLSLQIEPRATADDDTSPLPPHPCPVDDSGQPIQPDAAAAAAAVDDSDDAAAASTASNGDGARSSERRVNRFVQTLQKAATATTLLASGFGKSRNAASTASATLTTSVSRPQLTVEDVVLRVRVPGVRVRVDLTLAADRPIGDAVAMARAQMPANHVEALKRYEPFRLCLTSDDNGVLDRPLVGGCGLVLDDARAVRSIPPDAYLWLSPMPCMVRVCNTLDQVSRAGAALVSGGTPLSYIALTFRRANQGAIPADSDLCFTMYEQADNTVRWLRSSRSLSGHGLCSEPDASGQHDVAGVMLVFASDLIGATFDARRAASCATISGSLAFGTMAEHRVQWLAIVEFLLLVYNAPQDARPTHVLALDNYSCSSKQPAPGFIQLRRRDGGDTMVLHGADAQLRQWMSHLLVLEQTLTMPCSVLGTPPPASPFATPTPLPTRPAPKPLPAAPTAAAAADRASLSRSSTTSDGLFVSQREQTLSPPLPRRQPTAAVVPARSPPPPPTATRSSPSLPAAAPLSPRALPPRSPYGGIPGRVPEKQAAAAHAANYGLGLARKSSTQLAVTVNEQAQQTKELSSALSAEDEALRVAEERRERLRQIRAERAAIADRRAQIAVVSPPSSPRRVPPTPAPAPAPAPAAQAGPVSPRRPPPVPGAATSPTSPTLPPRAPVNNSNGNSSPPLPRRAAPIAPQSDGAPTRPAAPQQRSSLHTPARPSRMPAPISRLSSGPIARVQLPPPPSAATVVCASCGTPAPKGKFCMSCGAPLPQI